MSVDLYLELPHPVLIRALLPEVGRVLADMLCLSYTPNLTLDVLENGQRKPASDDELRDNSSPLFLISIAHLPETVSVIAGERYVTLEMGAQRTTLEYLLGAAAAIALARQLGKPIGDDWHFFGEEGQLPPDSLLARLRVTRRGLSIREAAELASATLGTDANAD